MARSARKLWRPVLIGAALAISFFAVFGVSPTFADAANVSQNRADIYGAAQDVIYGNYLATTYGSVSPYFIGRVSDPDGTSTDMAGWQFTVDWGDGTNTVCNGGSTGGQCGTTGYPTSGTTTYPSGNPDLYVDCNPTFCDLYGGHHYTASGRYTVTVHSSETSGTDTDSDSGATAPDLSDPLYYDLYVTGNCSGARPEASCTTSTIPSTYTIHTGDTVSGNVAFETDGGNPVSGMTATIDWGDSTASSGTLTCTSSPDYGECLVSGSHRYTQPGTYTITTTVTDSSGNVTADNACTDGATTQQLGNHSCTPVTVTVQYMVPNGQTAYDIGSSNYYCTGGGTACMPVMMAADACLLGTLICPNLNYADAEAFGRPNGSSTGTPDQLVLVCTQGTTFGYNEGYADAVSSTGNTDYGGTTMNPFTGVYGNSDLGAISGKGTVFNDPANGTGSEDNPAQTSSISASVYDPWEASTYSIGTVTGTQNTDNTSNTLNSGQFHITIRGTLYHVYANSGNPYSIRYYGTISCTAGGSHAYDLKNAGLDSDALAEGEIENVLGDNSLYSSLFTTSLFD